MKRRTSMAVAGAAAVVLGAVLVTGADRIGHWANVHFSGAPRVDGRVLSPPLVLYCWCAPFLWAGLLLILAGAVVFSRLLRRSRQQKPL